jgi:light-regulated signal transduction histidine kinase (bacteriophytochrome)
VARKRAEEALQKAHDELELRVKERTSKLATTTKQLKLELAERRRVEESLRQSEEQLQRRAAELERSNRALGQFVYVASHDLQEPLRTVVTYLRLLERGYKGKLGEEADGFIAYATDAANRMYGLLDRLLRGTRVGLGHKPFQPSYREKL